MFGEVLNLLSYRAFAPDALDVRYPLAERCPGPLLVLSVAGDFVRGQVATRHRTGTWSVRDALRPTAFASPEALRDLALGVAAAEKARGLAVLLANRANFVALLPPTEATDADLGELLRRNPGAVLPGDTDADPSLSYSVIRNPLNRTNGLIYAAPRAEVDRLTHSLAALPRLPLLKIGLEVTSLIALAAQSEGFPRNGVLVCAEPRGYTVLPVAHGTWATPLVEPDYIDPFKAKDDLSRAIDLARERGGAAVCVLDTGFPDLEGGVLQPGPDVRWLHSPHLAPVAFAALAD